MSNCSHNCSSCSQKECKDRNQFEISAKEGTSFRKIIAVMSGKGGVGKSLVTSMLAVASKNQGYDTAVLDADITGPSIPKTFGVDHLRAQGSEEGLYPVNSKTGIKVMSINLLLEEPSQPVVWRGPVISGVVKQFYTDVLWGETDIMFIDMPPGTGDVPLTVFQSFKVDGIVVVTTPQDLVSMIVEKSVKMANMMNVPILGVVENMSYAVCPECNEKLYVFGKGKTESVCKEYGLPLLAKLPINEGVANLIDKGEVENVDVSALKDVINKIMEK